ncbi:MAG: Trk system potassium transporter TrkA [bacterium]|nr:Trk system potassium transporter TrkA [bacterium]
MKIVIIGAGKISTAIIKHATLENHEVTVVDTNSSVIQNIVDSYDCMGLVGNGLLTDTLYEANANKADMVIAATRSDETNMLACYFSKKMGAKSTIARIRNYEYSKQLLMLKGTLGITMTINPELESAREIARIINFPNALKIESFGQGNVDLVEFFVPENSPLIGQTLYELNKKNHLNVLVCAVERGEEVFIPKGQFKIQARDRIHITCERNESRRFMTKLGFFQSRLKSVLIIGGGGISVYLAEELLKNNFDVKIIESDLNKCNELAITLPNAKIIHGDGTDQNVLDEEGIDNTDAIVCLTGNDEENIILSLYAHKKKVTKIITKINKVSYGELMASVDMASIIYPKEITASQILSYIRATSNTRGNQIKKLYKLINDQIEVLEFEAGENSKILDTQLKDLKLKNSVLIGGIIRNNEYILPTGSTTIQDKDRVIIVTNNTTLNDMDDILI